MSKERRWSGKDAAESNKEKENRAYDTFAEMIIEKLENVKADWKKPWFTDGQLAWPKSIYGKPYHGMNALMLTFLCEKKGYKIPIFATSARINDLNFRKGDDGNRVALVDDKGEKLPFVHVLKGEKAFPVFLSQTNVVNKETRERITFSDYMDLDEESKKQYNVYHNSKVYPVFNVDQTNLKEARPEIYQKYVSENVPQECSMQGENFTFPALDCMVTDDMWICPINPTYQDQAYYSPVRDVIVIPAKNQFDQTGHPEAYYGTMLHEMIHSTGSEKHLNRHDKENQYDKAAYAREELVAELGAALCCHRYGMDKVIKEDSLPYLKGWLQNLHEKPEFIKTVLKDVKAASALVFTKVEIARQYAEKEDQVKDRARETKLDARLESQEDDSIDMDDDGVAVEATGTLAPDKKQGEEESKEEEQKKENERQEEHRRSFRR